MEAQNYLRRWIAPCLALFAASTMYSQSFMDLFSTFLCFFCVYFVFWRLNPQGRLCRWNDWRVLFPRLFVAKLFWIWWGIVAIGFFLNDYQHAATAKVLISFKWILIWYVLIFSFRAVAVQTAQLFWASLLILSTTVYSLFFFFLLYDPGENIWFPYLSVMRTGGIFHDPMTYAQSFGMIFFVFLGALVGAALERQPAWDVVSENSKMLPIKTFLRAFLHSEPVIWKSRLNFASLLLLFVSVFLSMTRGVWIGIFVGLVLMAFLVRPRLGILCSVMGVLFVMGMFFVWKPFADRVLHIFDYKQNYDMQRITIWKANWNIFLDHPWFGIGYTDNVRRLTEYYARMGIPEDKYFISHAHNQYLHILAGSGIFGLIVFLAIMIYFLVMSWKSWKLESSPFYKFMLLGCLCAQVCFHVAAATEANYEHSKVRFVLMLIWAFVIARYLKNTGGQNENFNYGSESGNRVSSDANRP